MKNLLLICLFSVFSSLALARTTYVTGRGQASGYCSYSQGFFCIDNVKQAAVRDGQRDAEWTCQLNRGRSESYASSCNSNCFPSTLFPRDQNVAVQCTASCTVPCDVQD